MKKNQKGFMLAETLIVATFISVMLVYLFIQLRNINNTYNKSIKYNGVNEMYILEQISNYLQTNDITLMSSNIINSDVSYYKISDCDSIFTNSSSCTTLFNMADIKTAIYMSSDNLITSSSFSNNLNDYIKTIKPSSNLFIIVAEFNDGSVASIKVSGYKYKTLKESIEQMDKVTSGSGLYFESYEKPIYVFKGKDKDLLNNNIEILGYNGRIISTSSEGVKVYLDLTDSLAYDNSYAFFTSSNKISGAYLDSSISDSLLFASLNSKTESSEYIKIGAKHGVGQIENIVGNSLENIINSENSTIYQIRNLKDFVVTLNVSDIIRTSINVGCNYNNVSNNCLLDNWLTDDVWTMNYQANNQVWTIDNNIFFPVGVSSEITKKAYMVVYLDPNIIVVGDGTINHPFKIK